MPSPFPGMNPYLEHPNVWHDCHQALCVELRRRISGQLSPEYYVNIDSHVYIHEPSAHERRMWGRGDVHVAQAQPFERHAGGPAATLADAASAQAVLPDIDIEREPFLAIRTREGDELIAVVELLSPTNKASGPDREQYLAKRGELLRTPAHLLEIDLLRTGARMPAEGLPACEYMVMLSRCERRPRVEVWAMGLRDRLPKVPVPLRPGVPDVVVDLQAALDAVYDDAAYQRHVYRHAPAGLSAADMAWAEGVAGQK